MSLTLGMDANYINKIERGKAYPSMVAFFDICDFLGISQKDFFDDGNRYPDQVYELVEDYKDLEDNSQTLVSALTKQLPRKRKSRK
jgi:transcriptional regulator with XRE-family HTH domain